MRSIWKNLGISVVVTVCCVYALFLLAPLFLNGFIGAYTPQISKMAEDATGFKVEITSPTVLTTPKLTTGLKIGHLEIKLPTGDSLLSLDNAQVKLSLIPLLVKKIELDLIACDNLNTNIKVEKNGELLLEKYIQQAPQNSANTALTLPFGLKFSNRLPNITIKNYGINFIDAQTSKQYSISGSRAKITNFILNKSVKLALDGKVVLNSREQFTYNIKLFNKIMPDLNLNELLTSPTPEQTPTSEAITLNIIDIFKALYANQLSANLDIDVKTKGSLTEPHIDGKILVDNLSIAKDGKKLPESVVQILLQGNKIQTETKLVSGENELTQINGNFITGKHPQTDLTFKSNAKLNSIFAIIDSLAKSFNCNKFDTLHATGALDADFRLKSNLKQVSSSGHFKIPQATVSYQLYNTQINDINANISFDDNRISIQNTGFSILNQPLKLYGSISKNAEADLHLTAKHLQLKGILAACAQLGLLKENDFNSGTISLDAALTGKLSKATPRLGLTFENINIKNKPANTYLTLEKAIITGYTDGKNISGSLFANQLNLKNPFAKISLPRFNIDLTNKDIDIKDTYLYFNNSKINISGKITDYLTSEMYFTMLASGNIIANDIKNIMPPDIRPLIKTKGKIPVGVTLFGDEKQQEINLKIQANSTNYVNFTDIDELKEQNMTITSQIKISGDTLKLADTALLAGNTPLINLGGSINNLTSAPRLGLNLSTPKQLGIAIPGFPKSKMYAKCDVNIGGAPLNPTLAGAVNIPGIKIPSMQFSLENLNLNLSGNVATGKGRLQKMQSGGIIAENLSAGFNLKNYSTLYLTNITGDAFKGKITGEVVYDILQNNAGVNLKGVGLDALDTIEGATGLKNALSGTLGFKTNISLNLANETEMMRSLKGIISFNIKDGELLNLGRFENMLWADNITSNSIMKAALNSIVALPTVKETAKFKTITGDMTFSNSWANLTSIKTSGPSMSYYITGRYNLLNATANVVILGRLSAEVVKLLGPVGELSVDKITAYIPKFGTLTSAVIKAMTTNPRGEKVSEIPALSSGNTNYKDFKVTFNGGVESKSSVKSFKWLTTCDTSAIDGLSLKEQLETTKNAIDEVKTNKVNEFRNNMEEARKQNAANRQQLQNIQNNLKTLLKPTQR